MAIPQPTTPPGGSLANRDLRNGSILPPITVQQRSGGSRYLPSSHRRRASTQSVPSQSRIQTTPISSAHRAWVPAGVLRLSRHQRTHSVHASLEMPSFSRSRQVNVTHFLIEWHGLACCAPHPPVPPAMPPNDATHHRTKTIRALSLNDVTAHTAPWCRAHSNSHRHGASRHVGSRTDAPPPNSRLSSPAPQSHGRPRHR